jgi:hypothetical protein
MMPAFVAAYVETPIPPFVAYREEMFIMHFVFVEELLLLLLLLPPSLRSSTGSELLGFRHFSRSARRVIARQARIVPWRFVRRISRMCSSFARGRREACEMPAALTRISTVS